MMNKKLLAVGVLGTVLATSAFAGTVITEQKDATQAPAQTMSGTVSQSVETDANAATGTATATATATATPDATEAKDAAAK